MKKNLITGVTLASFALICALLLAIVNMITAPEIEKRNKETINSSIIEVCETYKNNESTYTIEETTKENYKEVQSSYIVKNENGEIESVIYVIDYQGYASTVEMMISVNKNHEVEGSKVISSNETKGDITTHDFKMQGEKNLDSFDKLAGSSISSAAVRKCYNLALYLSYEDMPKEGGVN